MSFTKPTVRALVRDFSPGFLDTPEQDSLPYGATPDAKNAFLFKVLAAGKTRRAVMGTRPGSRLLNSTAIASGKRVDACEFPRDNATSELIAVCNGTVYKFDGVDTFVALSGGTGFTVDAATRFFLNKNNLFISDGTKILRYDGTSCKPVGFIAPTAAPAFAAAAGPGVTGTYEGFAVWYDSTTDHESSPSATAAAVVLANQTRQWTKPAGAPPANVDNWRVYCRRTDTNENDFFRVGTVVVGTATLTESVSDTARRDIGPRSSVNDVPPTWAFASMWKGYPIFVLPNDSYYYAGKFADPESAHPKDKFPVRRNEPTRSAKPFGDRAFLIQTDTKSYRLDGDRVPFSLIEVHSGFGNMCQDACVHGSDWFYAWDKLKGPYRTNLVTWEPLADARIETLRRSISRLYLNDIRCVRDPERNLIIWSIPTAGTSRRRTLVVWHEQLEAWLPPMTGLEYSALCTYTNPAGVVGLYAGDYWGRVYELFSGTRDGVPSGTTTATITAATASTITAGAAAFYTLGDALAGMPAAVLSPAGNWQWVRVQSNTGTVLTLDTTNGPSLSPVPDPNSGTWTVIVGGIEWYWWTALINHEDPTRMKRGHRLFVQAVAQAATHTLEVGVRFNGGAAIGKSLSYTFTPDGAIWGTATWGSGLWASGARKPEHRRLTRSFDSLQVRFRNYYPDQPMLVSSFGVGADLLPRRPARG